MSNDWRPIKLCPLCGRGLKFVAGKWVCRDDHDTSGASSPQERFLACPVFEALYGGAAGGGKAAPLSTRICTPTGWTTMGEIRVGDEVIDADGAIVTVMATFDVLEPEAWELTFDDGTTQVACADHQWVTITRDEAAAQARLTPGWREARKARRAAEHARRVARRANTPGKNGRRGKSLRPDLAALNASREYVYRTPPPRLGTTRSTREIVATLRVGKAQRANHAILNPAPIKLPRADLLIDPYTLGVWLGDGSSRGGQLSGLDSEVLEGIEQSGFEVHHGRNPCDHYVVGLAPLLRRLDLLKPTRKRIPQEYLRASVEQRLDLLQGLCDTDGHATEKGSVEFTTTTLALRDGMVELLASLGIKPSVREGVATLRGRKTSRKWCIQFWTELPCFRIARKLVRQKRDGFRGTHDRRYVVAARPVPSEPMRCITVDSPTRTYLIGDRMLVTHNTEALLAGALRYIHHPHYHAILFRRTYPELKRSLIERSQAMYRAVGGHYTEKRWRFPSGAIIELGHMAKESDVYNFQSDEYQYVGFDEVEHFTEKQYTYMISRLRSSHGIPLRLRAGANPGGIGREWMLARFAPWIYPPDHPDYEGIRVPPETRLYVRHDPELDGEVYCDRGWHDPRCVDCAPDAPCPKHRPKGRTFIPAKVKDNPFLAGTEYEANLDQLDAVERRRLKFGDWMAVTAAGQYFQRGWVDFVDAAPPRAWRVRAWDLAASEVSSDYPDPDWTRGVKLALTPDGTIYVEDVASIRGAPGRRDPFIRATAEMDGRTTSIVIPQDPGAGGKAEALAFMRLLAGFHVVTRAQSGDKVVRFGPFSSQASPHSTGEKFGRVRIVRGAWNNAFLSELEKFPSPGVHDDHVDATSDAYAVVQERAPVVYRSASLPTA